MGAEDAGDARGYDEIGAQRPRLAKEEDQEEEEEEEEGVEKALGRSSVDEKNCTRDEIRVAVGAGNKD